MTISTLDAPAPTAVQDAVEEFELLDLSVDEYNRRRAAAARVIAARINDPAARHQLFAMLGLPAVDERAA